MTKNENIWWSSLTNRQKRSKENQVKNFLLKQTIENYGYSSEQWTTLSRQHIKARVNAAKNRLNISGAILDRLYWRNRKINYCIGQSFNEELIMLLNYFEKQESEK